MRNGLLHDAKDVLARFIGLRQCHTHDFFGDALDLDVHLQRRDTTVCTGHFEVHVAEVIFVAEDVGQHGKARAFFDQTHRDTCDGCLQWNASVHQCKCAAAYRSHRR